MQRIGKPKWTHKPLVLSIVAASRPLSAVPKWVTEAVYSEKNIAPYSILNDIFLLKPPTGESETRIVGKF